MTFEEIQNEYEEDITWNELNARSKISLTAQYIAKYQKHYFNALLKINTINELLGKKYQEKYIYYKMDADIQLKSTEIKTFIESDTEYLKLKSAMKKLEIQANFFEECIKNINSMRWDIKTDLELRKFQEGVI